MYYKHFGLTQPPFKITPDTRLFFPGGNRGAVLEALIYAVVNGEGMIKVVGEVGSGKTMLCRMLEVELPAHVEVVYLANPSVSPEHILHAIAFELKLPVTTADDRLRVMQTLQDFLLHKHAENRRVVMFVEEAQSMPIATLEQIRLLSNLETGQDKLLQIVLFGQPELDRTLAGHDIRQLKERITYSFYLEPFKTNEIREYINSRLRASGQRAGEVFKPGAVRTISRYSKGLVRRVNILADKAMLAAYAAHATAVAPAHVRAAARDSEFEPWTRWQALAYVGVATAVMAMAALAWVMLPRGDPARQAVSTTSDGPIAAVAQPVPSSVAVVPSGPAPGSAQSLVSVGELETPTNHPAEGSKPLTPLIPASTVVEVRAETSSPPVAAAVVAQNHEQATEAAAAPKDVPPKETAAPVPAAVDGTAAASASADPRSVTSPPAAANDPLHTELLQNAALEPLAASVLDMRRAAGLAVP